MPFLMCDVESHLLSNNVRVHFAYYRIAKTRVRLHIPCRSNLHRIIRAIFFGGCFRDKIQRGMTKEDARYFELMIKLRKDYSLWRKVKAIIDSEGTEKGKEFLFPKLQVLALTEVCKR